MPRHILNIYQRPKQRGMAGFSLARYNMTGYKHRIIAMGGFDTASGALVVPRAEAEIIISNYIECVIQVIVDNPLNPAWEGFITRITYRVGGVVYTRSTDQMGNRTRVTYFDANAATPNTQQTVVTNNAVSQAIYGVKVANLEAGVHYNSANITHLNSLRDTLNLQAYPQISSVSSSSGDSVIVEIEMQGLYYYAFDWDNYVSTDTTMTNSNFLFQRITCGVDRSANASDVIEDTTAYPVTADALIVNYSTFQMSRESRTGQTYLQFIQSIVEAGDGSQQWVWGITSLEPNRGTRNIYYKPASSAIAYTYRALKDYGRVRDLFGAFVPGWKVRPDAVIQVTDVLTFYDSSGDDPRRGYIMAVDYDGDSGLVTFQSGDNITMEGALGTNRYFKRHGGRVNNAQLRLTR